MKKLSTEIFPDEVMRRNVDGLVHITNVGGNFCRSSEYPKKVGAGTHVLGPPKATDKMSVEELVAQGLAGWYRRPSPAP